MKNYKLIYLSIFFSVFIASSIFAQTPQGMKYQALARDTHGNVLVNQEVSLQISLQDNTKSQKKYYVETHSSKTNKSGLFSLIIGEGVVQEGNFKAIPWSMSEVWMQIAIKENDATDYTIVSNSKLLAVPYAFHAGTASNLVSKTSVSGKGNNGNGNGNTTGSNGNNWSVTGNVNTDSQKDKIGTTDQEDFVFVTNDTERMRIIAAGKIITKSDVSVEVGKNLQVKGERTDLNNDLYVGNNVSLNTNEANTPRGETINHGSFTVENKSLTLLTGTLDVNDHTRLKDSLTVTDHSLLKSTLEVFGNTTLKDSLTVINHTVLKNNLYVDGETISYGNLTVENTSASLLTGTLDVDDHTRLKDSLTVTDHTTLEKTLHVKNESQFDANVNIVHNSGSHVATFENTNEGNGDGLKIKLGNVKANTVVPEVPAFISDIEKELVKNLISCEFSGDIPGLLSDIVLEGIQEDIPVIAGLAVGTGNLLIDFINQEVIIPTKFPEIATPSFTLDLADLGLDKISVPSVEIMEDFTLLNKIDFPRLKTPSIPIGIDGLFSLTIPRYTITNSFSFVPKITFPHIDLPEFEIPLGLEPLHIPGQVLIPEMPILPTIPSLDLTALGIQPIQIESPEFWGIPRICLTDGGATPLNNENEFITFTDNADAKMGSIRAVSVTNWAENYLNPSFLFKLKGALASSVDKKHGQYHFKAEINDALDNYKTLGVEYSSGNGDYAEWLERLDINEAINPGDIVGVIGGKITRDLTKAEQVMAVSSHPIVLGNMPNEGKIKAGNNIAFMGQIPVKVMGPVATGDYIVGKGAAKGYGVAINPKDMTAQDFKLAVGRAWEANATSGPKMVNTVIGVHNGDYINILKNYDDKFKKSEARIDALEAKLDLITKLIAQKKSN